ncbi:hypothetical protein GUJ93_ZPchr0004g39414 [Zizania palustris]|uniref:Uncharacterized protein n=1 Tax=Zizania palustris TaxID=103762 RepID=A0A8J5SFA2_ZIZPA|nr:hypothetical protein GUJ93_ZPchr0004g39414 [Zizania palustris]
MMCGPCVVPPRENHAATTAAALPWKTEVNPLPLHTRRSHGKKQCVDCRAQNAPARDDFPGVPPVVYLSCAKYQAGCCSSSLDTVRTNLADKIAAAGWTPAVS